MKNAILLTLLLPLLSACGIIGTAVGTAGKVVKTAVDIVVENDTDDGEDQPVLTYTE